MNEALQEERSSTRTWIILIVLGAIAVFLGWQVFTIGMADLWVDSNPQRAIFWRPDDSEALFNAAEDRYTNFKFSAARDLALGTAAHYPLDGRPYRVLGRIPDFFGDRAKARELFATALKRAPRDLSALTKTIDYELKDLKVVAAMEHVDRLMSVEPRIMPDIVPLLELLSSDPTVLPLEGKILAGRPAWRPYFLATLAAAGSDSQAIDRIFAARGGDDPLPLLPPPLGARSDTKDDDEPSGYTEADLLINRQIADGRWGSAYVTWIDTLTAAQRVALANVYDGTFMFPHSGKKIDWLELTHKGFGWQIPDQSTGVDVLIAPRDEFTTEKNVLRVTFNGLPLSYQPVKQLLVLAPGHYKFSGMGEAGSMDPEDGLQWAVVCAERDPDILVPTPEDRVVLGRSREFAGDINWLPFQFEFDVPASDCGAQWLELDTGPNVFSGEPLQGGAIFDKFKIVRMETKTP